MHTSFVGKVGIMPSKYDQETRAKAIWLVTDHVQYWPWQTAWKALFTATCGPPRTANP
jgi:transposase